MTNTTTLPADWAIERALEVSGCGIRLADVKEDRAPASIIAFARYIESKEQPPVDRWLLQARELAADLVGLWGNSTSAETCRAGGYDNDPEVQAIAAALLAAFEQGKAA